MTPSIFKRIEHRYMLNIQPGRRVQVRCLGVSSLPNQIRASTVIESRELTGSPSSMQTASTRSTQLIEYLHPTTARIPAHLYGTECRRSTWDEYLKATLRDSV
ncbi:hypothetical protein TMatcc_000120 [Talaromyces marneffei ATCC 18224]